MKIPLLCPAICLLLAVGTAAQEPQPSPRPEPVVPLRARLLDFGGALANEGFRLRDGFWSGRLEPGKPRRLAVNLFAGNQYWFCAATGAPEVRPVIALYDPQGEPVTGLVHHAEDVAAVGVTAGATGRYIIELATPRGAASEFCLIYLFK
jgi:hypothetical protein